MDVAMAYDVTRYNFTEDTWRTIFAFESRLKGRKLFRKVNFKKGEERDYISWIRNIVELPEVKDSILICNNCKENRIAKGKLFSAKYKLAYSFKKNKYVIPKMKKEGLRYSFEDVTKFLAVLKEAEKYDDLLNFLSIPDVWFIVKNVRENWEEFTEQIKIGFLN